MERTKKRNGHNNNTSGFQIINETESIIHGAGDYGGVKRSSDDAGLDNCTDSDNDALSPAQPGGIGTFPTSDVQGNVKPGKKTRGRVKIDMKYIDNKLRRYTTFSKRKTGIMKKAYELSTLTGTQVMLLVASETGHVYTFATRKLQPMITSETGKALIQTCLNSPDLGQSSPGQVLSGDQRMNPNGFEETEITYSQEDDNSHRDTTSGIINIKQENTFVPKPVAPTPSFVIQSSAQANGEVLPNPVSLPLKNTNPGSMAQYTTVQQNVKSSNMAAVQLPPPGFMLQTGGNSLPPMSVSPFDASINNSQNSMAQSQNTIPQYSAPSEIPVNTSENQTTNTGATNLQTSSVQQQHGQHGLVMSGGTIANSSQPALVYQTPGMVYAAPQQVPEGLLLQTSALAVPPNDQQPGTTSTPQYITIPVPVSLANAATQPQMFSIPIAQHNTLAAQEPVDVKKS